MSLPTWVRRRPPGSCSATAGSRSSAGGTPRPPRERVGGAAVRPAQPPGTRGHRQGKASQGRPIRYAPAGSARPRAHAQVRRRRRRRGAPVGTRGLEPAVPAWERASRRGASTKAPLHTSLRRRPRRARRSTLWRESWVRGQPGPHRELRFLKSQTNKQTKHPRPQFTLKPASCTPTPALVHQSPTNLAFLCPLGSSELSSRWEQNSAKLLCCLAHERVGPRLLYLSACPWRRWSQGRGSACAVGGTWRPPAV